MVSLFATAPIHSTRPSCTPDPSICVEVSATKVSMARMSLAAN
jgi:hypothetical protein